MKSILYLTLNPQWFRMILSREKREEYREIKDYWNIRLEGKEFTHIRFTQGYGPTRPWMEVEFSRRTKGIGNPAWGGNGTTVHILHLGNILSTGNIPTAWQPKSS